MQKISEILIESEKKRDQIVGRLIRLNNSGTKIQSYCALGAIGCELGLIKDHSNLPSLGEILMKAGIPEKTVFKEYICNQRNCHAPKRDTLYSLIWHLNDHHRYSFKKIGKILGKLGF